MMLRAALCAALICGAAAAAQTDLSAAAIRQVESAAKSLKAAERTRDPVPELTKSILTYEAGLSELRAAQRDAVAREAQLSEALQSREAEIAQLLVVLQTAESAPQLRQVMHPAGPVGAARAGMMLAEVEPTLQARAEQLRADLQKMRNLRAAQTGAQTALQDGIAGLGKARAALAPAMDARADQPKRFTEDPVRTAILISSVETVDGFVDGLSEISANPIIVSDGDISNLKGKLDLPVRGEVQRQSGKSNGITVATQPRALVISPAEATIRYRGPLFDMGNVVILEPQADLLLVFAGLADMFGNTGDLIPAGTPLGLMGGTEAENSANLSLSGDGTGAERSETLYIETRQGGRPVDPGTWFRTDKDG